MARIGVKQATEQGYIEVSIPGVLDLALPNSETRRGRVQRGGKVAPTITTTCSAVKIVKWCSR